MYFPRNVFEQEARAKGKSEEFINATLSYVDHLNSMQLPVIFSLKHLAVTLDFPYNKMKNMVKNPNQYYNSFKIRKRNGGFREIKAPKPELKIVQKWIYKNILKGIKTHESCKGFSEGTSTKDAAMLHQNQQILLKVDIKSFFESITQKQVYLVFKNLGYKKHVAYDLSLLTTYFPEGDNDFRCLPQGASTSPALANLVVKKLDHRLSNLSDKLGVYYTRYADDLIFSGLKQNMPRIGMIKQILRDEGFYINPEKTAIQKKGNKQIVLGLTVTDGVHVPKSDKKEIWTHLRFCKIFGPLNHLEHINQSNKAAYKDWLYGKICYINSIEPQVGKKMMDKFNQISWPF